MNVPRLLLAIALLTTALEAHAQSADNAVYFELGGSGIVPTINYERRLNDTWYGRAGLSYVVGESIGNGETTDRDTTFVVPLTVSWLNRPSSSHHLELGGGLTLAGGDRQDLFDLGEDEERFSNVFVTGIVGYRFQRPSGGFQFRAVATPVAGAGELLPWAGLSFGYAW